MTPGFVDLHSHLDAQIGWDPLMSSSCWHGVTSVVMGNCGMTFAPVRPGAAEVLADGDGVGRGHPGVVHPRRSAVDWESYGEYLDVVDTLPKGINTGGYVGDVALRHVRDRRRRVRARTTAPPTTSSPRWRREVERALDAGALGYSISRSLTHRVPDGRWVPGTLVGPVASSS